MTRLRVRQVLLLTLLMTACGGNGGAPTSPSQTTPTRIIAVSGNLAFGDVPVGSSKDATLTISNSGNAVLTFTGMSASGGMAAFLTWSAPSTSVQPGASVAANIKFSPTSAGAYSGTVSVTGDQTSGTNTISVSGTGTQTAPPTPTCNVTLTPSTLTIGDSGSSAKATVQVTVASGCAWTATADSWLTVRPSSGTGSASIEIEGINYAGATRSTQLRVGGAVATVTQQSSSGSGGSGGTGGSGGGSSNGICSASGLPSGTTAVCNDGNYSQSQNRSGTCSTHGGVRCWVCPGALCNGLLPADSAQDRFMRWR